MKTWMRRAAALLAAALLAGGMTAAAADNTAAVYTLTQEGNNLSMTQQEGALTFWEAPDVVTGQTRRDGTITLRNQSSRTVDFVLSSVTLPYDNEAALTYLDALSVDVSEGERLYYHGTFTRLMDADRAEVRVADVAPDEERVLHVAVSCAYTYTGQVPSYSSMVWSFTPQVKSGTATTATVNNSDPWSHTSAGINWLYIVEAAGALVLVTGVAGICRWLVRRRKK